MVIFKISGGLGNQMFQYAVAAIYAEQHPEAQVKLDIIECNQKKEHNGYYLDKVFTGLLPVATIDEVKRLYFGYISEKKVSEDSFLYKFRNSIKQRYDSYMMGLSSKYKHYFTDFCFNSYVPVVLELNHDFGWYVAGYWQNANYFTGKESFVRNLFSFSPILNERESEILERIKSTNSVSIHLRRGDYVGSRFDLCSIEYYKKAIEIVEKKVESPVFFFFSEDKDYIRDNFSYLNNYEIVDSRSERCEIDLYLMSKCRNNIIANSTFSFWGAYLNDNHQKIVISPEYQFVSVFGKYRCSFDPTWYYLNNLSEVKR